MQTQVQKDAVALVNEMLFCYQGNIDEYTAKQCALVCVNRFIKYCDEKSLWNYGSYWEELKQAIEAM